MKIFCDTSVLIARSLASHPFYERSATALKSVLSGRDKGYISTHALAEFFAVLTSMPLSPRIHPRDAQQTIRESILPHFQVIDLGDKDYSAALERVSGRGFSGGMIYDALHVVAAERVKADLILTFNAPHFQRLALEHFRPLVRVP